MKECQKNDRLNRIWNSMGVWIKGIMITFTGRMALFLELNVFPCKCTPVIIFCLAYYRMQGYNSLSLSLARVIQFSKTLICNWLINGVSFA